LKLAGLKCSPSSPEQVVKKVKSMQMFHTPVTSAMQGDRLGICVTQFDPKLLERGLVCAPDTLYTVHAAIISVEKIPYFRGPLQTKSKFHITVGHDTVMGRLLFFSPASDSFDQEPLLDSFDFSQEYLFQEQYLCKDMAPAITDSDKTHKAGQAPEGHYPRQQWALVEFEKPVTCPRLCLVIGSRLDADIHTNTCRLAFHGILLHGLEDKNYTESFLPTLKVYKLKHKHGLVERVSTAVPGPSFPRGGRIPTVQAGPGWFRLGWLRPGVRLPAFLPQDVPKSVSHPGRDPVAPAPPSHPYPMFTYMVNAAPLDPYSLSSPTASVRSASGTLTRPQTFLTGPWALLG
jgi:hypothetical protein